MPYQNDIVDIETFKEMRKWQTDPSNGLVVWGRPNFDNRIENRRLYFKGPRWWRRNFTTNVGNVSFYGNRHFSHLGQSIQLRQILSKGHEIRIRGQQDETLGQKDVLFYFFVLVFSFGCLATSRDLDWLPQGQTGSVHLSSGSSRGHKKVNLGHITFFFELNGPGRVAEERDIFVQWIVFVIIQRVSGCDLRFERSQNFHFFIIKTRR
mmetsp:Transcript_54977/g.159152  ORF Transcript_54977/g.159152 Transcript_54977/m.159152 type:complete len:208 (+) Transcript_54977:735-1358(+)